MSNNVYLGKSLLNLFSSNNINNIDYILNYNKNININKSHFKIYDNKLYFIYNDEIYSDTDIHEYINFIQNHIKNIYPEYGNEWYMSYKKYDTNLIYTINNLCNIL